MQAPPVMLVLRIALTLGLVAAVLYWIGDDEASGIEKIASVLSQADLRLVLLVFGVSTFDRALMAFKWGLLLRSRGLSLPLLRGIRVYCSSLIWGLFLPSTVGADAIRAALTMRAGLPGSDVVASMVVERLVGFLSSLVTGLLGLLILSATTDLGPPWSSLWWMASLVLLGGIAMVGLSFSRSLFDRLLARLPASLREQALVRRLERLHAAYVAYGSNSRAMAVFATLTLAENGVSILIGWVSALALHVDVGLLFVAGALPVALLASRLPVSIDGIGVFEGVFAALMLLAGVPQQEAVSIALLGRLVQIASWLPWWFAETVATRELRPPPAAAALPGDSSGGEAPGDRPDRA